MTFFFIVVVTLYAYLFVKSKKAELTIHYEESILICFMLQIMYLFYDKWWVDVLLWILCMFIISCITYLRLRRCGLVDSVKDHVIKAYFVRNTFLRKFDGFMVFWYILICYVIIEKIGQESIIVRIMPVVFFVIERSFLFWLKHFRKQ